MSAKFYSRLAVGSGTSSKVFHSKFGSSILKQLGWKEGEGIGLNRDGRTECVQLKRRADGLGLGAEATSRQESSWGNWWDAMYNEVASKMGDSIAPTTTTESQSPACGAISESSASSSDDDTSLETIARSHVRKRAERQLGKLARVKQSEALGVGVGKVGERKEKARRKVMRTAIIAGETRSEGVIREKKRKQPLPTDADSDVPLQHSQNDSVKKKRKVKSGNPDETSNNADNTTDTTVVARKKKRRKTEAKA